MPMSDVALYRKYRPQTFDDVAGQDHIVTLLSQSIKNGRISHAYLFAGSRGIGKTTIARILAREIGTDANDIYEIDAASNRGIDDIRALREAVHTLPMQSMYKVYIIDEVHMLTKEAFNALLKTLEEPPVHAVFILATTELEKIPETIISRCQVFQFKKPNIETLRTTIIAVAKKEGFTVDDSTADLVAVMSDGAYRDALGILQKILGSASGKKISYESVSEILGTPSVDTMNDYITAFLSHDMKKGIEALAVAKKKGGNMALFARMVLARLRSILLVRFGALSKVQLAEEYSETEVQNITAIAGNTELKLTSGNMISFINAVEMIKKSPVPELPLELVLFDESKKE